MPQLPGPKAGERESAPFDALGPPETVDFRMTERTDRAEWNAVRYHHLADPQEVWGRAVLARLTPSGDERLVVDAGAGTGRLSALLLERMPAAALCLVDRSVNMLQAARSHLRATNARRLGFVQADLVALPFDACVDVVFSTATFHWVLDHPALFAQIFRALKPGGRLVAQCGGAGNLERIHRRALVLAARPEFSTRLARLPPFWEFADARVTAERLARAGFTDVHTRLEEAPTVLPDATVYAEFLATIVLRAFLERLTTADGQAFVDAMTAMAASDDPPYSLDYRRLNVDARKPRD